MRKAALTTVGLILSAVVGSLPAVAAGKPAFKEADSNGDGRVSIAEAKRAGIPANKAKANDLNGDGKLTPADWRFIDPDSDTAGGR